MIRPEDFVEIPAGPFLLGMDYPDVAEPLRRLDQARCLGLGAVLAGTPGRWVDLPAYAIMPRMVTNGEYQEFWNARHPGDPTLALVDDPEIWEYVWSLHPLDQVRVPSPEAGLVLTESYAGCTSALDALVRSHAYEAQRQLLGHHLPPSEPGFDGLSRAVVRTYAVLRRGLARSIWRDEPLLDPGQVESLAGVSRDEILQELARVVVAVQERLPPGTAKKVPLLIVLDRMRIGLEAGDGVHLSAAEIFRPLFWADAAPRPSSTRSVGSLFSDAVKWSDLPVVGVSLYESAAFAAWLRISLGQPVLLANEAEYEKAFGWTLDGSELTAARKHIFPWQGRSPHDFNQWFSKDGSSIATFEARAKAYHKLLDDTARQIDGRSLHQGLGFGWQWTRERFDDRERKYIRFEHAGCLRRQVAGRTVFEYRDCTDQGCAFFAVRGAPYQLGGPGTVTRRFALYPLRGYAECGLRCVIGAAGEV